MPVANLAAFGITGQHQSNLVDEEEDTEDSQAMPAAGEDTFAALREEREKLDKYLDAADAALDEEKLDGDSYPSDEEAMMRSVEAEIDAKYERRHRQEELAARASTDYQKALAAARQSADHELFDDAYPELSRGLMARERDAERPNLVLKIGRQSGDRKHPQGPGQFFGPKYWGGVVIPLRQPTYAIEQTRRWRDSRAGGWRSTAAGTPSPATRRAPSTDPR